MLCRLLAQGFGAEFGRILESIERVGQGVVAPEYAHEWLMKTCLMLIGANVL